MRADFTRTAGQNRQTATVSRRLAGAQAEGSVRAAVAALMARYSGETEVVVATGRETVTVDLSGDPTFAEIERRVAGALRSASGEELVFDFSGESIACRYDAGLFRAATIEGLLRHVEPVLEDVARNGGGQRLSELSFLSAEESQRLLVEWNNTAADYPRHQCIHQMLEAAAASAPDAIAAQFQAKTLSYGELEARANQLAQVLAGRGAGSGMRVGISLERSLEMLVAVLAVLKTGAAYLPLDPSFPKARLEFMASDAEIGILVTSQGLAGKLDFVGTVVLADEPGSCSRPLGRDVDPGSVAYVLYTSGSTGKPKGVEVPHRAVMNLLHGIQTEVQLRANESLLAVTTLSFDISMLELFLPLLAQARVVIASRTQAADPQALRALLQQTKPALMQATPVTWRMLEETGWGGLDKLKVLVGGERVSREIADSLLERASAVWNVYGPTETTIWSTICKLERNGEPVSIGRPIANTTLYVLDANQRLVPIGAAGELYIGGDGVACGYLNRPELTTERFVANPFGAGRLYRTGDVVRYLRDGRLEMLGRNDGQVKVRGFRIELGDVEAALAECPEVSAAAAVVREGADGESVLAGYFVPRTGGVIDVTAVRSALSARLPEYMVPTHLVAMRELPLTPNGKIDRKALPAVEVSGVAPLSEPVTAGADALETTLIGIWESTLGIRPIKKSDNFFDLGGHSVLAARIFARMEKALGKSLPLATLFQAPTVEALASIIRKSEWKPMWSSLVPIRPKGTRTPFFFVHPIGGNVLNFSGFCSHFGPDQPIYGLQARGLNGEEAPHTSVEAMASDYIQSIQTVQPEGPYFIGGFSAGGVVAFEMARQLQAMAQPVGILALLDTEILTLSQDEVAAEARLHHWWRMAKVNVRYASRMSLSEFIKKKAFNLRMRRKLFAWTVRERLGLAIDPTALNAEEAFLLAFKRYEPKPYFGNATLFRAGDGAEYLDPMLGWRGIIRGRLDIKEVSGDHDTILQEPDIGMLARLLETCLEQGNHEDEHQPAVTAGQPARREATSLPLAAVETWGGAVGGKP